MINETPRYVKKEMEYHGKVQQCIIDTHIHTGIVIRTAPIDDNKADELLKQYNTEYENHLKAMGVIQ